MQEMQKRTEGWEKCYTSWLKYFVPRVQAISQNSNYILKGCIWLYLSIKPISNQFVTKQSENERKTISFTTGSKIKYSIIKYNKSSPELLFRKV